MSESRYAMSIAQLESSRRVTPMGAQTFSKSYKTLPAGIAPLYARRAEGAWIEDIDGHRYVDLVSGLASVNLGYGIPEIAEAVTRQLQDGVTISLSHPLEEIVAQQIIDLVPSAEMVHFGKNGSDATTAAIRIARGATGRDHVVVCGYHGWQDWFIGSMPTRSHGVPRAYADLIHPVPYNDLAAVQAELEARPVAAIMLEPMTTTWPAEGYLEGLRALADQYGAILVFDEMVTGFRFAPGGAQEYFGVTPDLSAFGKGIANGFPLSAIVGRRDLMEQLETAFISGTFGGELLSLAAARVVLERIATTDVIAGLARTGAELRSRVEDVVAENHLSDVLTFAGHPAWTFAMWSPAVPDLADVKNLFMQEMSRNGVLMMATHNVTASHGPDEIDHVVAAYRATLPHVRAAVDAGDAASRLDAQVAALAPGVR